MTDVGEFIDDFLQHDYDPVKRREYYLRTRKLVGRGVKKAKKVADNAWETDKEYNAKVNKAAGALARERAQAKAARRERVAMQQRRLDQARAKARKLKDPTKRRKAESKLDSLQRRLKKALVPGKVKVSRSKSRPISDFKAPSFKGVKVSSRKRNIDLSNVPVIGSKR